METVSATEQENAGNKRKPGSTRSASVHSTTSQYVPGHSAGASAPPARPSTSMSNKRPRLGDSASSTSKPPSSSGAAPLGSSRAHGNVPRPASPGKSKKGLSSLPRPVHANPALAAGKLLSVGGVGYKVTSHVSTISGTTSRYGGGSGLVNPHAVAKKATRAKRESFKPRHSDDASSPSPWPFGMTSKGHGGRWGSVVKQECRS
jgi:protein regulator of cytokinesis 1